MVQFHLLAHFILLASPLLNAIPIFLDKSSSQQATPWGARLSLTSDSDELMLTWSTYEVMRNPSILLKQMSSSSAILLGNVRCEKFVDGGSLHNVQYVHRIILQPLKSAENYTYRIGECVNANFTSCIWLTSETKFRALPTLTSNPNWSPRLLVYGDLGVVNAQSVPRIISEAANSTFDVILHIGDFAYDMADDNGKRGNSFLKMMEPVSASYPYMTCPGNHENQYNFSNYKALFSMPDWKSSANMFYSFNLGRAHIVMISTEFYFYVQYGLLQIESQFEWLEQDLMKASSPSQRAMFPWIILAGHRPMYCSAKTATDCTFTTYIVRRGIPILHWYALEPLLAKYGVDVAIWAHEHNYERMWPVYDGQVYNGSFDEPYVNPKAPVHLLTGSAGCQEIHDFFGPPQPYSAFRATDYGYSRLNILNDTHLHWQQVSDDKGGVVIDDIIIVQQNHGPFHNLH